MKLTLETERLILRPFEMNDAEAMFNGWTNDPEVTKFLKWNPHENIETTKSLLDMWIKEYEDPKRLNFAIELKSDGTLIGGIDIVGYENNIPEIGYNLSRKYWNNGYMTEACRRLIDYLFSQGYGEIRIDAAVENTGSNRVIRKCGGVFVKTEDIFLPLKNKSLTLNRYIIKAK